MPIKRSHAKTKVEGVRFTEGQLAAIDRLVATEKYGSTRADVIRFFVMRAIADFDGLAERSRRTPSEAKMPLRQRPKPEGSDDELP
jgi:hypothetical protein